jgi:hypothetical protein
MFLSIDQIERSLTPLLDIHNFFGMSFLAFKRARLPEGRTAPIVFSHIAENILESYYKPSSTYDGYYNPFKTSRREQRWMASRYGSTTLQRITADTFSDALLHPKNSSDWGWKRGYVNKLRKHLGTTLIPAFDLAVWLFRNNEWPRSTSPETIRDHLLSEFDIAPDERSKLFDLSIPPLTDKSVLAKTAVTEAELIRILGGPPGAEPEEGAAISFLGLTEIGPASSFHYEPADRLNIITGDNSLGKTFILECVWWALTGGWLGLPMLPRKDVPKTKPTISFRIRTMGGQDRSYEAKYHWDKQSWTSHKKRESLPGLVIYARFDGSFAVWDPARTYRTQPDLIDRETDHIFLSNIDIWEGLPRQESRRTQWLCNGLLRDWVSWQTSPRYAEQFKSLTACLKVLSPDSNDPLQPADPTRLPSDSRDIPTLRLPYGEVPILHASAGIQRVVGLCYIMVWAWHEHLMHSETIRRQPQRRLVLLIDEVEAHLHPRWQRVIVPGIMAAISELSASLTPQIHLATHSPMVMASAETLFDEDVDDLHHLKLVGKHVTLEELPFVRRGTADRWLMSDVFALPLARSVPAEKAIEDAKALQQMPSDKVDTETVSEVHDRLVKYLAADDTFWARWTFFAEQHGVQL